MQRILGLLLLNVGLLSCWILSSIILFPHVKHDVCLVGFKNTEYLEAAREVLDEMQSQGIIKRGCSYKSVKITIGGAFTDQEELAEAIPNGLSLDEEAMTFIPILYRLHPRIVFSDEFREFDNKQLFQLTLVHEIGHILGVPHVNNKNHIMFPYVSEDIPLKQAILEIKELSNVR